MRGIGRRRHSPADEHAPIAHRARRGTAALPSESRGRVAVAVVQMLARKWLAALGLALGVIAQSERDRIDVECIRKLVERDFEREGSRRESGCTLKRRSPDVK